MSQHVAHRHSDEIHQLRAEIEQLKGDLADWKQCAEERLVALIEAEAKVRLLHASHAISAVSVPYSGSRAVTGPNIK